MRLAALAALALAAACIGQTPDDRERAAVADVGRHGPTHNPGSPCLLCHDFAIAGTVYQHPTDDNGVAGVVVTMTDGTGQVFAETTNSTGNFLVRSGVVYPVRVEIASGGVTKKMRSVIHQWGSCAECHKPDKGATSAGRIFLVSP